MRGYFKQVTYTFTVSDGTEYELTPDSGGATHIAETRCSGHEDTHFSDDAAFRDGAWEWVDGDTGYWAQYGHDCAAILAHLNRYGVPSE